MNSGVIVYTLIVFDAKDKYENFPSPQRLFMSLCLAEDLALLIFSLHRNFSKGSMFSRGIAPCITKNSLVVRHLTDIHP